jgi:hypothetical protein
MRFALRTAWWLDTYLERMVRVTGTTAGQQRAQARSEDLRAPMSRAAAVAMPYGFAASGLLLGVGGVAFDRPLAGACGAVAGVTAGLLERYRAGDAERRIRGLRDRLRVQRAEAELEASALRRRIRSLETQVWERDLRDVVATTELPVLGPPTGPIAQVIDLSEARGQAEPAAPAEATPARGKNRAAG